MQPEHDEEPTLRRILPILTAALLVSGVFSVLAPMLRDFSTYGFHDWDVETAYRHITTLSIRRCGELPFWHPFLCGGAPAWGYVEGATNLVSPYLPIYLLFDVRTAIRIEVVGGALLGLAGAYAFATRFTQSFALRALLAALFVLNGRWALQAAVGHTWHLQYGLMPWAFFFFERALEPGKLRNAAYAELCIALMVFWGGIYPLPHTALLLSGYAVLLALFGKGTRPLLVMAIAGPVAVLVSGPKLFAVLDHMQDVPRLIESKEVIGLSQLLVMLTDPTQRYGSRPVPTPAYNWHEWGIYVGAGGVAMLAIAVIFRARQARVRAQDPGPHVPPARLRRVPRERSLGALASLARVLVPARPLALSLPDAAPARRGVRRDGGQVRGSGDSAPPRARRLVARAGGAVHARPRARVARPVRTSLLDGGAGGDQGAPDVRTPHERSGAIRAARLGGSDVAQHDGQHRSHQILPASTPISCRERRRSTLRDTRGPRTWSRARSKAEVVEWSPNARG